jgi:hypothetical protein
VLIVRILSLLIVMIGELMVEIIKIAGAEDLVV